MWTEKDDEDCLQWLNDQRIMREVNTEDGLSRMSSFLIDGQDYNVTDNEDGPYTHEWKPDKITKRGGTFEVESVPGVANDFNIALGEKFLPKLNTSTRLLKWQKRFVFRLPPPWRKIFVKLVLSRERED